MKRRIVILMSSLSMGGAERVAVSLANWIVENTNDSITILKFDNNESAYLLNDNVNIINMEYKTRGRIRNVFERFRFCKTELNKLKPDIIFAMFNKTELYALFTKPKESILIGSERCNINKLHLFKRMLSKYCSMKCDGFIFQTSRIREYFPNKVRNKSKVIFNAISNNKAIEASKKNYTKENYISAVGRLDEQKGFDVLIKSFGKVKNILPEYKLLIFGDGNEKTKLEKLINDLSLENEVILCGNDKDAIFKVAKSKLFVLSSRYEGMPNALIEAMATGTACISTDCDFGPKELIDNNENGMLVPVDDEDIMAEKIVFLLQHNDIRKKLEKNAKLIQNDLDPKTIYKEYYTYFMNVINQKQEVFIGNKMCYKIFMFFAHRNMTKILSDRLYLKILYKLRIGKSLNLKHPETFNEKLQWLKLYDRKEQYTNLVDKYEVRKFVEEKIGKKYLIQLLGVYEKFDDIDFSALPNKFVIKCTHDSGGVIICKDKSKIDYEKAKNKIDTSLKSNYYYAGREYPYKNVKPRVIVEKYMEDKNTSELMDYKIMCFNGEPKLSFTCSERYNKGLKVTFFDLDWNKMEFERHYPSSSIEIKKPKNYELMLKFSKILSENIPFVRVDWYEINGELYFGELTFYPGSGFEEFNPEIWDNKIGKLLVLPKGEQKNV